jgi:hypothetical protein
MLGGHLPGYFGKRSRAARDHFLCFATGADDHGGSPHSSGHHAFATP